MTKQDISENLANTAFLGIGSNIGNKKRNIEKSKFLLLKNSIKIVKSSNIYETYSWPDRDQPKFYNIVIKIITNLKPANLFYVIKNIEKKLGRKKALINEPRVCDIDILDYDRMKINKDIILPHPRLHKRNFVLLPLFELDKGWKHPVSKYHIKTLIQYLSNRDIRSIKQV